MRESKVEKHLREQVEARGGLCEKFVSPGRVGVPDRLITWRYGATMDLVETKAPNGKLSPMQVRDHARRAKRGIKVYVLNTIERVDEYIQQYDNIWDGATKP